MTPNGLKNVSFSMLMKYEACPFRIKLQYIDHSPIPPLPPDNPMERGNREHSRLEDYVAGKREDLKDAEGKHTAEFLPALDHARMLRSIGQATVEENWLFDADWNITTREHTWLWSKVDLSAFNQDEGLVVSVDYKTGKSMYKAVEHVQQNQLYAACTVCKYPWADEIITELWYLDEGHIKQSIYTREQALMYIGRFQARFDRMTQDMMFRPNPSRDICRYCPFSPRGTGACPVGV